MADKIYLKSFFGYREDTLENWVLYNPILEKGEPSIVNNSTDGNWLKIGDGVTKWVDLPYKKWSDGSNMQIDQTYNPKSENPQSGKAIAEAISEVDQIYTGSGEMPEGYVVQIDPNGDEYFEVEQIFNPKSANPQSGVAVAEANNYKQLFDTLEVTQEMVDTAGEEGITLLTIGSGEVDLSLYDDIIIKIYIPDSSTINADLASGTTIYCSMSKDEGFTNSDQDVLLRPQSNAISSHCVLEKTPASFSLKGQWAGDTFLYGQVVKNGYRHSYGYAGGVDGWTEVSEYFIKSLKKYFHIFSSSRRFKFPVGTIIEIYGR